MMKKVIVLAVIGLLILGFTNKPTLAWGPATHTYIAKKLNKKFGLMNIQEMYGGIAPDIFSYVYRVPLRKYFEEQMHHEFMGVLNQAKGRSQKAFARGFISHNEVWGADYLAHYEPGYVNLKADQLISKVLAENQFSQELKDTMTKLIELDYDHARDLARIAVEYSVDLLIKTNEDPEIGAKIILSTSLRDPNVPFLLTRVYARDEKEAKIITEAEKKFINIMSSYGKALLLKKKAAIQAVAEQIADLAPTALCIILPDRDKLVKTGIELINGAMEVCRPDYSKLLSRTIESIKERENSME